MLIRVGIVNPWSTNETLWIVFKFANYFFINSIMVYTIYNTIQIINTRSASFIHLILSLERVKIKVSKKVSTHCHLCNITTLSFVSHFSIKYYTVSSCNHFKLFTIMCWIYVYTVQPTFHVHKIYMLLYTYNVQRYYTWKNDCQTVARV